MVHIGRYPAVLGKWLAVGGLIGGVGGVIGSAFHIGVDYATRIRTAHPWILYLLPLLGLVIAGLYRLAKVEGKDTNAVIESVHFGKNVPVLLVPVIFLSTVLTHLGGGSAGREGAALQIGGGIGFETGRLLHLGQKDLPLATLCGMSAVFSALFGTPLTATVFAMEVISVGVFYYAGLLPCLTAALVGYGVSLAMSVPPTRFTVTAPGLNAWTMVLVMLGWALFYFENLGALGAFLGRLFTAVPSAGIAFYLPVTALGCLCATPALKRVKLPDTVRWGLCVVLLLLCVASLARQSYNPFIYFRF